MTPNRPTILVLLLFPLFLSAQTVLSNQEKVHRYMWQLMDSLATPFLHEWDSLGIQVIDRAQGKGTFLESEFVRYFNAKKKTVFTVPAAITFVFSEFEVKIRYRPGALNWLGMKRDMRRSIQIRCTGQIKERSDSRVLSAFSSRRVFRDQIRKDRLRELERTAYPFLKGKWQAYSVWEKYLEPALAVSSALIIIYLFFSVRT